jgi:hypothetical protein
VFEAPVRAETFGLDLVAALRARHELESFSRMLVHAAPPVVGYGEWEVLVEIMSLQFLTVCIALITAIIKLTAEIIRSLGQNNKTTQTETIAPQRTSSAFDRASTGQKVVFLMSLFSGLILYPAALGLLLYWAVRGSTEPLTFRSASFLASIGVTAVVASRMPKL